MRSGAGAGAGAGAGRGAGAGAGAGAVRYGAGAGARCGAGAAGTRVAGLALGTGLGAREEDSFGSEDGSFSLLTGAVDVAGASDDEDLVVEAAAVVGVDNPAWWTEDWTNAPAVLASACPPESHAVPAPPAKPTSASPARASAMVGTGPNALRESCPGIVPPSSWSVSTSLMLHPQESPQLMRGER